jgi:hypothetical protein
VAAYQATLRGLTIGSSTSYEWLREPAGLGGGMFVTQRVRRIGVDGTFPQGPDLLDARRLVFEVELWGGSGYPVGTAAMEVLADALAEAWRPVRTGTIELVVELAGTRRALLGRPISCEIDTAGALFAGVGRARLVFEAMDPRWFSEFPSSVVMGLTLAGGFTFPLTFPLTFGAGGDSDGVAVNAGRYETEWTATITGPVTTPRLTLGSTGQFVELDGVVPLGSSLVLSSRDGSILLDGSPRQSWLTLLSRWWKLPAGSNTVRFRAAAGSGSCSFSWRSAWL